MWDWGLKSEIGLVSGPALCWGAAGGTAPGRHRCPSPLRRGWPPEPPPSWFLQRGRGSGWVLGTAGWCWRRSSSSNWRASTHRDASLLPATRTSAGTARTAGQRRDFRVWAEWETKTKKIEIKRQRELISTALMCERSSVKCKFAPREGPGPGKPWGAGLGASRGAQPQRPQGARQLLLPVGRAQPLRPRQRGGAGLVPSPQAPGH